MKKLIFWFIFGFLVVPIILLILFPVTFSKLEMQFFVYFLISLAPCGLISLTLSIIKLIKSLREKEHYFTVLSVLGLILSGIMLIGAVFAVMALILVYYAVA